MNTQDLTQLETEALIDLIRITNMKYFEIDPTDFEKFIEEEYQIDDRQGIINLQTRELCIKIQPNRIKTVNYIVEEPKFIRQDSDYAYEYWYELLNTINNTLGFKRMVELFARNLNKMIEALSPGQSDAFMKKLLQRARHDSKTLSSTTRSQLKQIRDKIAKYQPLVDIMGEFFINKEIPHSIHQGPQVGWMGRKIPGDRLLSREVRDTQMNLVKTPPRLEEDDNNEDIEIVKEAANSKGLWEDEVDDFGKYFFVCNHCDFSKELDPTLSVEEQVEKHHGQNMFLRPARTGRSDY